jgi:hypothetical protein
MQAQGLWNGSFNGRECTLQQLSPFIGKLKSGIVRSLITYFTRPGEWVCDPFSGSGVVPLEALLLGRRTLASDLSIYASCLTKAKLSAPATLESAKRRAESMIRFVEMHRDDYDHRSVSKWVRSFFHPGTLDEILAAFDYCKKHGDSFLAACLCGILHHQRPGFLSFPASHMVPYLRTSLFPRSEYPELYEYRSLAERIRSKIERAYRRPPDVSWNRSDYKVYKRDARRLPFNAASVDLVLTSPPYYGTLDYARDNRLRLWFLGVRDWHALDKQLKYDGHAYERHMRTCLKEMYRVLRPSRYCVLIVGEVQRNGKTKDTGAVLGAMATEASFSVECVVEDEIPDIRRSRRGSKTTRVEKILVLKKTPTRARDANR